MNRLDLQRLADARIGDARILLSAGRHAGAYYLAGYAIECALKARIATRTREHDFPDLASVRASHTHDLTALLGLTGARPDLEARARADQRFAEHWASVASWKEQARYLLTVTPADALRLLDAIDDPEAGILTWVKGLW